MYENFLEWAEQQGLEFPCTATAFAARSIYLAGRQNEEPGVTIIATTLVIAKQQASRLLEAGAFRGQVITLREMAETADGVMRTDRIWRKPAGGKKWQAYGE